MNKTNQADCTPLQPDGATQYPYLLGALSPGTGGERAKLQAVKVPRDVRYLQVSSAGVPVLEPERALLDTGIVVEAVDDGPVPSVVLLNAGRHAALRINGAPPPPVSLLHGGDQLTVDGHLLHVAIYREAPVAPATAQQVGRECPLCRSAIEPGDQVYVCACGWGPVHRRSAARAHSQSVLECVTLLRECGACKRALILEEGWDQLPALR